MENSGAGFADDGPRAIRAKEREGQWVVAHSPKKSMRRKRYTTEWKLRILRQAAAVIVEPVAIPSSMMIADLLEGSNRAGVSAPASRNRVPSSFQRGIPAAGNYDWGDPAAFGKLLTLDRTGAPDPPRHERLLFRRFPDQ